MLLCVLEAGGKFTARSPLQHSFLGHGQRQRGPMGEAQAGRAAAAVFGFPSVLGI